MRPRRRLSEDERRRLTVTQGNLTALFQHPSWSTIVAEVERKERFIEKQLVALALHNPNGVPLEQQAYMRGLLDGMHWFLAVPANAERSLEKYLRAQGVQAVPEEAMDGP